MSLPNFVCFRFGLFVVGLALGAGPVLVVAQPSSAVPVYTLVDAVNVALKNNPELLQAQKRIEEAQGAKVEARAGFIPKLATSGSFLRRETDYATSGGANPNRTTEDWAINVRLTQNVYSGQGVRNRVAIAKLLEQVRLWEYEAAVHRVVMEVRLVFDEILAARTAVEVRRQAVELLRAEVKNQKARLDAGTVGELNVIRAEVSLANEFPALEEAENRLREGKVRLCQLLGLPYLLDRDAVPFDIRGQLTYRKVVFDLDDCLAKAEAFRPEIKARDLEVQVAEREIVVERSNALPRFDIFFGYDLFNETDTSVDRDTVGGYITGVQGTWNIFDGFATRGRVDQARARAGVARAAREATRNTVFAEVRTAFLQLQQADATVASQARNKVLARESFVLAQASFAAGLSSQLDILQARNDLTRAQLAELNARQLHRAAIARLERSIGSQVRVVEEAPAPSVPVRKTGPRAGNGGGLSESSRAELEDRERVLEGRVAAPAPDPLDVEPEMEWPEPSESGQALAAGP